MAVRAHYLRWCGLVVATLAATCLPARGQQVLHHWSFDGPDVTGAVSDSGPNSRPATPATPSSPLPLVDGKFNKAVSFDGRSSYLTVPAITDFQKTSFTVAAWVYLNSTGPNFILCDFRSNQKGAFAFNINPNPIRNTAQPSANLRSMDTAASLRRGTATDRLQIVRQQLDDKPVPLKAWHHLAWTWDREAATLTCYLDGGSEKDGFAIAMKKGNGPQDSQSLDIAINNQPLQIGAHLLDGGTSQVFNGYLDELWIFDTALTPVRIQNLMAYNDIEGPPKAPVAPPAPIVAPAPVTTPAPITPPAAGSDNPPVAHVTPPAPGSESLPVVKPEPPVTRTTAKTLGGTSQIRGLRMAGIITGLTITVIVSCYLIWAVLERGKLRAAGRL